MNLSILSKELYSKLTVTLQRVVTLAQEKGASCWLTCTICARTWFFLTQDCMPFEMPLLWDMAGFHPVHLPTVCVWHQLFCWLCPVLSKGWIPIYSPQWSKGHHSWIIIWSVPDWASSAAPAWWEISTENFQHSGWCTFRQCVKGYTNIWVSNPLAPSNSGTTLQSCYRKYEATKKRAYESGLHKYQRLSFWFNYSFVCYGGQFLGISWKFLVS